MNINDLEKIVKILKDNDVQEFELEQEGTHIRLTRSKSGSFDNLGNVQPNSQVVMAQPASMSSPATGQTKSAAEELNEQLIAVESPIVGTFYRRSSPDADPFVKEGDFVKKGATLCIIEAMKVMNEIEAACDGKIAKILLEDGQVVEYGEVLFLIDPTS